MERLVIVGAGFSGTSLALHLVRDHPGRYAVTLVERGPQVARGVAYGARSPRHVLNVPAGRMGVYADDEGDFLAWLRERDPTASGGRFVPRAVYGDYLADRLARAGRAVAVRRGEATAITPADGGWRVSLADGSAIDADAVVVASGNHAPAALDGLGEVADPWTLDWDALPARGDVLLVGTGLTMVDMAVELAAVRPGLRVTAVSRHGLLPRAHRDTGPPPAPDSALLAAMAPGRSPRELLHTLRRWLRAHPHVNWRDAVAWLRPATPALWQAFDDAQKRQFVRHLRAWWDTHRHRFAPDVAAKLQEMIASGTLTVRRGLATADGYAVVINCTGPETRVAHMREPLWRALSDAGLVRADPLGLGVVTDADYRLAPRLHYLGPMLRATMWEATAVPELRVHAARLAAALVSGRS